MTGSRVSSAKGITDPEERARGNNGVMWGGGLGERERRSSFPVYVWQHLLTQLQQKQRLKFNMYSNTGSI